MAVSAISRLVLAAVLLFAVVHLGRKADRLNGSFERLCNQTELVGKALGYWTQQEK